MTTRVTLPRNALRRHARLQIDDRVVVSLAPRNRVGGWITGRKGTTYRVVTDDYKRLRVNRRRLTRGRENVLLLEARLDRSLRSLRHQGTFLRELLNPFAIDVLYEKIHTKADLKQFLDLARRDPNIPYIHYVGHGDFAHQAKLKLTFESVDLAKDVDLFERLDGKLLIFSCCLVGTDRRAMERLLKASGAKAIITYCDEINDAYAFVAETLLYSRLVDTLWRPAKLVHRIRMALQTLEVKWGSRARDARSPLICFSR